MPTSEMSDQELSELIARFLEPKPLTMEPPPKCWDVKEWDNGTPVMTPHSMVTDPAMTVMLMEKLITVDAAAMRIFRTNGYIYVRQEDKMTFVRAKSLGRAVAEAFAAANGLGEG